LNAADPPDASPTALAPAPDFRYVSLDVGTSRSFGAWVGVLGVGAVVATALRAGTNAGAMVGAGLVATGAVARAFGWGRKDPRESARAMAIVPWGVLLEGVDRTRILRWPAIIRVQLQTLHGRDQGTPTTRYSVVTVETPHERFVGRAPGTLPLERLAAHLSAYAEEASHRIALDLEGGRSGEGPSEPDAELVLASARAYLATAPAIGRLGLSPAGYRDTAAHTASARATFELAAILRDRTPREIDPRPFAAVVAAELAATGVIDELVALVQSPLPLLAAIAKVAATKLGVSKARVGTLDEVEPFLLRRDVEALAAWQAA
jgi:hypothetical protein